ncbi:hypothetical protein PSP20601_04966 [Pandoraea sputorum]|nr:hypothetical protein PSP20601_04966 [Pandoraea sputorum]
MTVTGSPLNRRQFLRYSRAALPLVSLHGYGGDAKKLGSPPRPLPTFSDAWLRKIELELTTSVENVRRAHPDSAPVHRAAANAARRQEKDSCPVRAILPPPDRGGLPRPCSRLNQGPPRASATSAVAASKTSRAIGMIASACPKAAALAATRPLGSGFNDRDTRQRPCAASMTTIVHRAAPPPPGSGGISPAPSRISGVRLMLAFMSALGQ